MLLAEGKKVCDARAQGQKWDQLEQMVAKDLNLDPDSGEAGQFMVVNVDVRGRALECEVVKPPFVDVKTR